MLPNEKAAVGTAAIPNDHMGAGSTVQDTSPDAAVDFFRTSFAVLVRGKSVRRHLYFNLPAAERTVKRAVARGDSAELVLVRLVPVDARHLDAVGGVCDE